MQDQIGQIAQDDTHGRLGKDDEQEPAQSDVGEVGEHDGQHLVGGGEKDGQHGADGDGAGGKEGSGGAGDAALGHDAQNTAQSRTGLAGIAVEDPLVKAPAAFQQLHEQVGDKENGDAPETVHQAVQRGVAHLGPEATVALSGGMQQKICQIHKLLCG